MKPYAFARAVSSAALGFTLVVAACDNNPAEGKASATVQEVKQTPAEPAAPSPAPDAATYSFSQANSAIAFVGAKVTGKHDGSFKTFQGTIQAGDGSVAGGKVSVEIDVASLEADVEKLTAHLKSPDLLDAAKYPKARFTSTEVVAKGEDGQFTVTGNFELHGVTKQLSFPATIHHQADKIEADAEFAFNRKDFGIVYPGKPDDLIQDQVLIKLNIRAPKS